MKRILPGRSTNETSLVGRPPVLVSPASPAPAAPPVLGLPPVLGRSERMCDSGVPDSPSSEKFSRCLGPPSQTLFRPRHFGCFFPRRNTLRAGRLRRLFSGPSGGEDSFADAAESRAV